MFTIALQVRRLDSLEPEDENFVFRKLADWEFLIVSLYRLQRAAEIATATERGVTKVIPALVQFRKRVPGLKTMRDVSEHFDEYALDNNKRHRKEIDRTQLEVGLNSESFVWLGHELNAAVAKRAAEELFSAVRDLYRTG